MTVLSTRDRRTRFFIVFVVVSLHTLRHLLGVFYMAIYGVVAVMALMDSIRTGGLRRTCSKNGMFVVWLGLGLMGLLTTVAISGLSAGLTGISRFLYCVPIFLAFAAYTDDSRDLKSYLRGFVVFFGFASLTLPLQLFTGPISWFAAAGVRGGEDRFSSLVGSLTSIGIAVGCYLVMTETFKKRRQMVWIIILMVPSLMALSKAAIANIAIALAIVVWMNRRHLSRVAIGLVVLAAAFLFLYGSVPEVADRVDAVLVSFGVQNTDVVSYDTDFDESAINRLIDLPLKNFAVLPTLGSPFVYLVGGGYGMGSTALVSEAASLGPMTHNQFAEFFSVFGIFGGIVAVGVSVHILTRTFRLNRPDQPLWLQAIPFAYLLLFVNGLFANGTVYQPATGVIFFMAMFVASDVQRWGRPAVDAELDHMLGAKT